MIDDEIVRIKNPHPHSLIHQLFSVQFLELKQQHTVLIRSVIRRIKPIPVELRRQSINRATGHTFEYLGFGI